MKGLATLIKVYLLYINQYIKLYSCAYCAYENFEAYRPFENFEEFSLLFENNVFTSILIPTFITMLMGPQFYTPTTHTTALSSLSASSYKYLSITL